MNFKKGPIVTILGSCRQDSIYKEFKVTKIRDQITYPHYSKEVLQLISYCGFGGPDLETNIPEFAFRNYALGTKILSRRRAKKEFKKTDIFVIEIASWLEYRYESHYLHHEIYDNWNGLQNPEIRKEIEFEEIAVKKQSHEELRDDVLKIIELLGAEKVIFSTHLSTRESGTRSDLVNFIKAICRENGIEYFDPKTLLENYRIEEIAVQEDVLSHFSDFGHGVLQQRYRNLILEKFYRNVKKEKFLTQKYGQERGENGSFPPGFGDLIQGTILTYEIAKRVKMIPRVDISQSQLSSCLLNIFESNSKAVYISHSKSYFELLRNPTYFTNKRWLGKISEQAIDFAREKCLTPSAELKSLVSKQKEKMGISNKNYAVLHLRIIDGEHELDIKKILNSIQSLPNISNLPLVLLSNSSTICDALSEQFLVTSLEKIHIADVRSTNSSTIAMLAEYMIMGDAKQIYSLSEYEWGSSFAQTAAMLFKVPIIAKRLTSASKVEL